MFRSSRDELEVLSGKTRRAAKMSQGRGSGTAPIDQARGNGETISLPRGETFATLHAIDDLLGLAPNEFKLNL